MQKKIKKIHQSASRPIADLITYSPLPSTSLDQIDPFIFLNHHGFQVYPPNNQGLPFGPHPHRGMATCTFIIEGDILHEDSTGHKSVITAGGIQWMTAGRGVLHAELSSAEFMQNGGNLEILQLWVNLPSHLKRIEPSYQGVQKEDIPQFDFEDSKVKLNLIAGRFNEWQGVLNTPTDIFLSTVYFQKGGHLSIDISTERNVFFYVVKGAVAVNSTLVHQRQLVEFERIGEELSINAIENAILILGHAEPYDEPVVAHGPFVMNSMEEIKEAYADFRAGKFGVWK